MRRTAHWSRRSVTYVDDWLRSPIRARITDWIVTALLVDGPLSTVVDVGAGPGHNAAVLAARTGIRPVVVDGNLEMVERARAHRGAACQAVADALPVRPSSVDALILSLLLHHLPVEVQRATIDEAALVLRPGGRLVLVDQVRPVDCDDVRFRELIRQAFYAHLPEDAGAGRFDLDEEHPRSRDELVSVLEAGGFEVEDESSLTDVVWASTSRRGGGR